MFRNLTFFRFHATMARAIRAQLDPSPDDNEVALLDEAALKPVGPLELSSRGWVPVRNDGGLLSYAGMDEAMFLALGGEDKILPAAAVNRELAKRLKDLEEREGRKPSGRARKRIKEDVVHDLLPRALVKPYRLDGYLDLRRGLLVVDTASRKAAEEFVGKLRETLGSFPGLPVNAEVAPRAVLTDALLGIHARTQLGPQGLLLGDECELRDPADSGAVARLSGQDLQGEEVEQHLNAGKQCTRLGLTFGDRLSFTLGEDLVVRKLRFLDGAMDQLESQEREDLQAELDARATLLVGEVGQLFDVLEQAFRISKVEG